MDFSYLDPKTTVFEWSPDNTLRVSIPNDRCGLRVEAINAFPLSHPEEHIVLRDGSGKEIGVLQNLKDIKEPARGWIRDALRRRYFLPEITAIKSITERFGSASWVLETDRGPRTISTGQLNEAVFEVEPGRYLITDVEGNRYEIKSLADLDDDSRANFLGKR